MRRRCSCNVLFLLVLMLGAGAPRARAAVGWDGKDLAVLTSELSPAVLIRTTRPRLTLFGGLSRWGLGTPQHAALATKDGIRAFHRGPAADRLDLPASAMTESWVLVWFRGAEGWTQWDSPWLVVYQHRPAALVLDADGLHTGYAGPPEHVALMPLYGLYKPDTARWDTPPEDALRRCRFWARALREYPLAVEETSRIDPKTESVVLRSRFTWHSTRDDWNTPPLKFAPLSPTLALAHQSGRMPLTVSDRVDDPALFTAYGPYTGVAGKDGYDVAFKVLRYITETEEEPEPDTKNPTVAAALGRLRKAMGETFGSRDGLFHPDFGDPKGFADAPPQESDGGNTHWAVVSAQYYCRALPYLPGDLVKKAKSRLRRYFADWVLQPIRYRPFKDKMLLVGPGIGTRDGQDDAGKFSANVILTLWTYARYTGDTALIKDRWPLIKRLWVTPRECTWRGFGRDAIAEIGDEAAPALAMARLAHLVDDKETFNYAAQVFARELVHHVAKHTGAPYFVAHQPIHTLERMSVAVYPTSLRGDLAGWQIDGPTWPETTGERQYANRWVRFGDPDVARFHRDHLMDLGRAELDGLLATGRFTRERKGTLDDPHILPSMVRLRSLLLNEPPDALARITPVDAPVHPNSGVAAYCMAFLRTSRPPKFVTLIAPEKAETEWGPGIAQDRPANEPVLAATVQWFTGAGEQKKPGPPAVTWWGWKPPKADETIPGGDRWSFGQVLTDRPVTAARAARVSWNTEVVLFDL